MPSIATNRRMDKPNRLFAFNVRLGPNVNYSYLQLVHFAFREQFFTILSEVSWYRVSVMHKVIPFEQFPWRLPSLPSPSIASLSILFPSLGSLLVFRSDLRFLSSQTTQIHNPSREERQTRGSMHYIAGGVRVGEEGEERVK